MCVDGFLPTRIRTVQDSRTSGDVLLENLSLAEMFFSPQLTFLTLWSSADFIQRIGQRTDSTNSHLYRNRADGITVS